MVKLFQPRHGGSMVATAYGDWVSLHDYASMYEAKDARIAELEAECAAARAKHKERRVAQEAAEAKLAAVTDWANRIGQEAVEAKLAVVVDGTNRIAELEAECKERRNDTKAWKMLYRLNRQAHRERYKEDFKAMSKKQLRNALHGRIQYLLASDLFLNRPPTEQEARFLQKHERLMKRLQPGHRDFMPRA